MLSFILTGEGFSVITAEDGLKALDLVKYVQPDLIITDINMPNLDGIELTKQLREQFQSTSLPILVVSALEGEIVSEAIIAGATDAIKKTNADRCAARLRPSNIILNGWQQPIWVIWKPHAQGETSCTNCFSPFCILRTG